MNLDLPFQADSTSNWWFDEAEALATPRLTPLGSLSWDPWSSPLSHQQSPRMGTGNKTDSPAPPRKKARLDDSEFGSSTSKAFSFSPKAEVHPRKRTTPPAVETAAEDDKDTQVSVKPLLTSVPIDPDLPQRFSQFLGRIWLRHVKAAIAQSLKLGLEAYHQSVHTVIEITETQLHTMMQPSDYTSLQRKLTSLGVTVSNPARSLEWDSSEFELLHHDDEVEELQELAIEQRKFRLAMIKVYTKHGSSTGKPSIYISREAENLFRYSAEELFHIWSGDVFEPPIKLPLWVSLVDEEDWDFLATSGFQQLLGLPTEDLSRLIAVRRKDQIRTRCISNTKTEVHVDEKGVQHPHSISYCFVELTEVPEQLGNRRPPSSTNDTSGS
jgi:hypothetical protein